MKSEIIFEVQEAAEGGFRARGLGHSIFNEGDGWRELRRMVKDAVACHFADRPDRPCIIRLHFGRDEVTTA
jgi:hypothetical protein